MMCDTWRGYCNFNIICDRRDMCGIGRTERIRNIHSAMF